MSLNELNPTLNQEENIANLSPELAEIENDANAVNFSETKKALTNREEKDKAEGVAKWMTIQPTYSEFKDHIERILNNDALSNTVSNHPHMIALRDFIELNYGSLINVGDGDANMTKAKVTNMLKTDNIGLSQQWSWVSLEKIYNDLANIKTIPLKRDISKNWVNKFAGMGNIDTTNYSLWDLQLITSLADKDISNNASNIRNLSENMWQDVDNTMKTIPSKYLENYDAFKSYVLSTYDKPWDRSEHHKYVEHVIEAFIGKNMDSLTGWYKGAHNTNEQKIRWFLEGNHPIEVLKKSWVSKKAYDEIILKKLKEKYPWATIMRDGSGLVTVSYFPGKMFDEIKKIKDSSLDRELSNRLSRAAWGDMDVLPNWSVLTKEIMRNILKNWTNNINTGFESVWEELPVSNVNEYNIAILKELNRFSKVGNLELEYTVASSKFVEGDMKDIGFSYPDYTLWTLYNIQPKEKGWKKWYTIEKYTVSSSVRRQIRETYQKNKKNWFKQPIWDHQNNMFKLFPQHLKATKIN